ncbi:unnamed protein product, partial [Effrenium voratum]
VVAAARASSLLAEVRPMAAVAATARAKEPCGGGKADGGGPGARASSPVAEVRPMGAATARASSPAGQSACGGAATAAWDGCGSSGEYRPAGPARVRRAVDRLAENLSTDNAALREQLRVQELEAVRQLQEQQGFFENKMLEQHFSFAQAELQHKLQSLLQQSEQQLAAAQKRLQAERRRRTMEEYDEKLAKMQKTMAELNERNLEKHLHNWRMAMQQQQAEEEKQKKKEGKKPQPKQKSDKKRSPPSAADP